MKRENLIIDVGAHNGQDTAFYLAKGFSVVAIEANPALADHISTKLASHVRAGKLRVLKVAIASDTGTQRLGISDEMTIWSSLSTDFIRRNEGVGTAYRYVDVPTMPFDHVLAEFGIPYYLKIDIEGLDMLCVEALYRFRERPTYLSVESHVTVGPAPLRAIQAELTHLQRLGYTRFQYVNQRNHSRRPLPCPAREGRYVSGPFAEGASGPFGRELPPRWQSATRALAKGVSISLSHNLSGFGGRWSDASATKGIRWARNRLGRPVGWYDLHAWLG
jgi:FkbM family methyltransferase